MSDQPASHVQEFQRLLILTHNHITECVCSAEQLYDAVMGRVKHLDGTLQVEWSARVYRELCQRLDAADLHSGLTLKPYLESILTGVSAGMILGGAVLCDSHRQGLRAARQVHDAVADALGSSYHLRETSDLGRKWAAVRQALEPIDRPDSPAFISASLAEQANVLLQWAPSLQEADRRPARAVYQPAADVQEVPDYVTLDNMAALVSRSKRTLEKRKGRRNDPLPVPDVEGGGGRPDEWRYATVRPWLEKEFSKRLPERFPRSRFRDCRADRS